MEIIRKKEVHKNDSVCKNYLTIKQADYIYIKIELWSLSNKNTMKEEIDPDVELGKLMTIGVMKSHRENK